ncbi:MAG TPA: zinc-binding dehydrogenase [Burkholderiales bacterium]|nr:zinc-binding dehydrogenase [Burkholderiales bacterium]
MKALVIERQGGVENLAWRDWPDPQLRAGDVLVRVRAVGLNHLDIFVRRGMPGFPVKTPFISGGDIVGEVAALGAGVSGWRVGERVAVHPMTPEGMMGEAIQGGMAELARVPATHLVRVPDALDDLTAAAVPINYATARRMLFAKARLQLDERLLVLGASGGVGIACVQFGKLAGARVIAAAGSREKCERLREQGADEVIDYAREDFSREAWRLSGKQGVDVVVNFTGGETWNPSLKTLRKGGRLVTCGATAGFDAATDIRYVWVRELQILGSDGYTLEDIAASLRLAAEGRLKPVLHSVLPVQQAAEGHRLLESRAVFGKVVLKL